MNVYISRLQNSVAGMSSHCIVSDFKCKIGNRVHMGTQNPYSLETLTSAINNVQMYFLTLQSIDEDEQARVGVGGGDGGRGLHHEGGHLGGQRPQVGRVGRARGAARHARQLTVEVAQHRGEAVGRLEEHGTVRLVQPWVT